jgi:hypothetical protein
MLFLLSFQLKQIFNVKSSCKIGMIFHHVINNSTITVIITYITKDIRTYFRTFSFWGVLLSAYLHGLQNDFQPLISG